MIKDIILKFGVMQFLSIIVSMLSQFGFIYLWSRYLPSSEVGLISLTSVITSFALLFSNLGVTNYVLYKKDVDDVTITTLNYLILIITSVISMLIILSMYVIDSHQLTPPVKSVIYWAVVMIPIAGLSVTSQAIIIKQKRLNEIAMADIITRLVSLLSFCLLLISNRTALSFIISQNMMWLSRFFILFFLCRKEHFFKLHYFNLREVRDFWPYAKSLVGGQVLNTVSQKIDELIFAYVFSVSSLGIYYTFKQLILQLSSMYFNLMRRVFSPFLSGEDGCANFKKIHTFIITAFTLCLFFMVAITPLLFKYLFKLQLSDDYIYYYISAIYLLYLRYISGNIQTLYFQLQGFPLKELHWNVIQVIIVTIPALFVMMILRNHGELLLCMQILSSFVLFVYSNKFFHDKKFRRNNIILFQVVMSFIFYVGYLFYFFLGG